MIGDMQTWTPNVAGIIEHAREIHPKTEIISRLVSGEIHRSNYENVCIRARKLASALEKDGIQNGDVVATLALNTCLLYTSPSPRDRTRSRMPSSA